MRFPDWPERLYTALEEARLRRFKWGEWDCAAFCGGVVFCMTGVDYYEKMRGRYSSENEAAEIVRKEGAENYEALLWRMLGEPVPIALAARGDILLHRAAGKSRIGVCLGERAAFAAPKGLTFLASTDCEHAWRVI